MAHLHILERAECRGAQRRRFLRMQRFGINRTGEILLELIRDGKARELPIERLTLALGCQLYDFTSLVGDCRDLGRRADEIVDLFLHGLLTPSGCKTIAHAAWEDPT